MRKGYVVEKKYEYLGGLSHLRGMMHWYVCSPSNREYHIRKLIGMSGYNEGVALFVSDKEKTIIQCKTYNDAVKKIYELENDK